jgi:hypothetical protein
MSTVPVLTGESELPVFSLKALLRVKIFVKPLSPFFLSQFSSYSKERGVLFKIIPRTLKFFIAMTPSPSRTLRLFRWLVSSEAVKVLGLVAGRFFFPTGYKYRLGELFVRSGRDSVK